MGRSWDCARLTADLVDRAGKIPMAACHVFSRANARRRSDNPGSKLQNSASIARTNSSAVSARRISPSTAIGTNSGSPTATTGLPVASISYTLTGLVASVSGTRLNGMMNASQSWIKPGSSR